MSTTEEIDLTEEDKENMRTFLMDVYRSETFVGRLNMNEQVFAVVQEMIDEAVSCSNRMDLVPQPKDLVGGRGGVRYTRKVLEAIGKRYQENQAPPERGYYLSCRNFLASNYRTPLGLASQGL